MPQPRRMLISLADTSYYHCIGRCVRQAFLCGINFSTGQNFEHRRQWVVDRLALLAETFCIDVCSYAIMSNHYHLVVRIDRKAAQALTDLEVIEHWSRLFALPETVCRFRDGNITNQGDLEQVQKIIVECRSRLSDLSWFMRCLNEYIARRANAEDGCTGRFWEGRFKSQALLDEAALLACMSYVDLNPVRAGMAMTLESSDYTSVQARIKEMFFQATVLKDDARIRLMPFRSIPGRSQEDYSPWEKHLPFLFSDYLQLLDLTGRLVSHRKSGSISSDELPILKVLGIDAAHYLKTMRRSGNRFGAAMGSVVAMQKAAKQLKKRFVRGIGESRLLFATTAG